MRAPRRFRPEPPRAEQPARAASPCLRDCRLDGDRASCLGCGRTLGEIAAWGTLSDLERAAVWARLRRDPADCAPRPARRRP